MKILVACEESQAVTKELRRLGHEAYSCDIIECSGGHPEWHIMQDVLPLLNGNCAFNTCDGMDHEIVGKWDMIIAFPPCTHLAVSGAAWFENKRKDGRQKEAIEFFMNILNADCEKIAVENPVNIISGNYIGKHFPDLQGKFDFPIKPSQAIQPYEFGDEARKKTCLWLKGVQPLIPTNIVSLGELATFSGKTYSVGASADMARDENGKIIPWNDPRTAKIRSKTFPGIAKAMAEQWAGENKEMQEREVKEMELKVKTPTFPEVIEFNFEELKKEITERASAYVNLVYTDDQIQDAKKDRAALNKFVKALSDERIKIKKECMKPYEDFEKKIKELDGIVNKAIQNIDGQIKSYDEQKKAEKLDLINKYWNSVVSPDHPLKLERVMDLKWLNATVSMKSIQEAINGILAKYAEDIATLQKLPEYSFEAIETYKSSLDLGTALNEVNRLSDMAKCKAEEERIKAERKAEQERKNAEAEFAKHMNPPVEEQLEGQISFNDAESFEKCIPKPVEVKREWISFSAFLTTEDALALRDFFQSRNIEFVAA